MRLKISKRASAARSVSMVGSATASGYRVVLSTRVKIYLFPRVVVGLNGPMISTATLLNGSSIKGILPSGTLGTPGH